MEKAEYRLDETLTALGTVYSQILVVDARDVESGRAQRLDQDIDEQVQALQDIVETVDELQKGSADVG